MTYIHELFDRHFPTAEELWERGGAEYYNVEFENGHVSSDVPFFPTEVEPSSIERPVAVEPLSTRHGREIGRIATYHVMMTDGVDRLAQVRELYDTTRRGGDYTITSGAAWFTRIDGGYVKDRLNVLSARVGVDSVAVGAAHSTQQLPHLAEWLRLPRTVQQATLHSLAKGAQQKQAIITALINKHQLAPRQYKRGDSMDDMETSGEYVYAALGGAPIVQHDTHARCGFEDLALGDMPRFGRWLADEAASMPGVGIDLLRSRMVCRALGTVSLNPNFLVSSVVGNMPALASDEARRMTDWMPTDAHGHQVVYTRDGMSSPQWKERLAESHPNVYVKAVDGVHLHLIRSKARRGQLERTQRYDEEYQRVNGRIDTIDRAYVYHLPVDTSLDAVS